MISQIEKESTHARVLGCLKCMLQEKLKCSWSFSSTFLVLKSGKFHVNHNWHWFYYVYFDSLRAESCWGGEGREPQLVLNNPANPACKRLYKGLWSVPSFKMNAEMSPDIPVCYSAIQLVWSYMKPN